MTKQYLIALDDGHGMETAGKRTPIFEDGTKSKETGKNFMHENEFNRAVVKYLDEELKRCGFKTLLVAPTDKDTSLQERVNKANNAKVDAYVSVHANAVNGKWGSASGVETYIGASAMAKKLGNSIHKNLIQGTKQKNRGVKDGTHLYVIRKTIAPAVLAECAFMDNLEEAKLLLSDAFRRECAIEIAKGICETFEVNYKPKSNTSSKTPNTSPSKEIEKVTYRVRKTWEDVKSQIGAFTNLDNAKQLADKNSGYEVYDENGKVIYNPSTGETISKPKPSTKPKANLEVDGYWGKATTKALQKALGTVVDGVISGQIKNSITSVIDGVDYGKGGSLMVKALQKKIGAKVDGYIGTETIIKLQKYLGTIVDGKISTPSNMVKELQRRLNEGKF